MEVSIQTLSSLHLSSSIIEQTLEIFYATSSKTAFSNEEEKSRFQYKYFGIYLKQPESFFVALRGVKVIGYLAGSLITSEEHFQLHPYLEEFRAAIRNFPAHLHINFSAEARGLGLGSLLIKTFEKQLKNQGVTGVHLITSLGERNVGFYQKNNYQTIQEVLRGNTTLLMLGKLL